MNEFKDNLKVDLKRKASGEIVITESLKDILIKLMKGDVSKKQVIELTGIGDKNTVERKVEEIVWLYPELKPLYDDYIGNKSLNFNGYTFRAEAIEMLRRDYSQSKMAERMQVNRRTYSTKMKKLQEDNKDNILGILLKEHAYRKMNRQELTQIELIDINLKLDKYEEEFPVTIPVYEERDSREIRIENIQNILRIVEELRGQGMSFEEIFSQGIISESSYRKYRKELENLTKISDQINRNEE